MTFVVLFILAVVWAVYLFSWLRGRHEHRNVNSISSFNKHLSVLERTSPARLGISATPARAGVRPVAQFAPVYSRQSMNLSEARRRRRDILFGLMGLSLVSLMLTVVVGGPFVYLLGSSLVLTGAYVALLIRAQRLAFERQAKVRYLPGSLDEPEPTYLVPRSVSANY